ncbi:hypothetical protein diail_8496 [Diaporthe ilicicola]|nr:hypothetical protein diail_8496 [Diaporthe ilicicola]
MGKFKGRGGRGGRGGGRGGGGRRDVRENRYRADITKEHERMEKYYNELLELPEEEKATFWEALRRELPNSFRFCGSKGHALTVKRLLEKRYIPEIVEMTNYDGMPVEAPLPVPWYPDNLAWWMTTPKNVIRRYPPFAKFQKFLVSETSVGNISRQEVVSMIPPLLLDVKPGHVVLDLCAAPGSKAAQLLEMLHQGEEGRILKALQIHANEDGREVPAYPGLEDVDMEVDPSDDGRATGLLIANDMDYKRSHLLIHQLKRLSSPNMIVTNHDATLFPSLQLPSENSAQTQYLKFDRILADVPCSGDGTLRKNVNVWKDWNPGNALGLHQTQVRILVRALQMLKPGGRVVYSTCSMNPVENESVIAAAIERCGHENVEILDCSNELPGLQRVPGMTKWKVMDKSGRIWNDWKEVQEWTEKESRDGLTPGKLVPTMFPRKQDDDTPVVPLERCIRVYAHQQDTGAFFITALHKKKEFKAKPESGTTSSTNKAAGTNSSAAEPAVVQQSEPQPEDGAATAAALVKAEEEGSIEAKVESPAKPADTKMEDDVDIKTEGEGVPSAGAGSPLKRARQDEDEAQPEAKRQQTDAAQAQSDVPPTGYYDGEKEQEPPVEHKDTAQEQQQNGHATPQQKEQTASDGYGGKAAKKENKQPFEEPFKFLSPDNPVIKTVQDFYKISPRFPSDRYMVRNAMGEPAKAVYYTSALVRDVLTANEGRSTKFVHGGVKMFMKQDAPSAEVCRWRIQSEGIPILQGYVGQERVVVLRNKETLRRLLIEMFPRISDGEWQQLDEIGERVRDIGMGCLVLRIEPDAGPGAAADEDFSERMVLPLWKSFHSLNLMLPKEDRSAMLLRIYNDTTPLVNSILKRDQKKAEGENGAEPGEAEAAVEEAVAEAEAGGDDASAPVDAMEEDTPAAAPAA